jgi:hypothetical protein
MSQIFAHINRDKNTIRKYDNQDIDISRSYLNQHIIHGDMLDLNTRLSEVSHQKRKDLVACCGVVITLPVELHSSDLATQNQFFNYCTDFIKQKFGEKNVVYSTIHHDETTPHVHIGFVPVTKIERKYRSKAKKGETYTQERISAKDVITKSMLNSFHTELDCYITEKLGQKVSILTGKTEKNLSINELKKRSAKKLEKIEQSYNLKKEFLSNLEEKTGVIGHDFGLFVTMSKKKAINLINSSVGVKEMKSYLTKIDKLNQDYLKTTEGKKFLEVSEELKNLKEKNKDLELENNELKKQMNSYSSLVIENRKLREENNKLKEFKDLAMNVIKYSYKVLESIKCFDFNSNALSSSINRILDYCKNNNLSIGRSRTR